jgi:phospholipid transport system transporter-binding protein
MLSLPATLTLQEASQTLRTVDTDADGAPELSVDASALQEFDSSALAVLLECRRRAQAAGKPFRVLGAPPKLIELAQLYGVDSALPGLRPAQAPGQPAAT